VGSDDLVLLHGQPGLSSDWHQVIERLPGGLRAVAPDRPGHGASTQAGGGFEVSARAVLADLDARGISRAVLVGHSYGGGVALTVAARAPGRVKALVLLASVGPGCLNGWDALLAAPGAGEVCSLLAWRLTPWIARARLRRLAGVHGADHAIHAHVNLHVWGHARWDNGSLWRTFLAEQRALVREAEGLAEVAAGIGVPVLLMADPRDPMVPFRTALELERLLPDARLQVIRGAGHHLPLRAAEQVATQTAAFVSALNAKASGW
jgi:pimeloyl-ACP methyl ester carboxylesterase